MGLRPCVLSACLHLLSRSRTHHRKQVFIACGALQRVWRRNFIYKRLVKLWQERFCYGCETHMEEKEATEISGVEELGKKKQKRISGVEELGKKKQKRNDGLCRRRTARILHRVPSARNAFNRVSSWSHYVEESIASELSAAISAVEADSTVDMSQLFLGQKFASGAHSRLYHGIYKNRAVAVKLIMPPQEDAELSFRLDRQFSQEVTLLSQLRHGNVIEFVAACKKPPVYCVITEYLPGGSLKAFLHKSEPHALSTKLVTRIALDVARGMEYLHSQGVMHRDLKSDNLIITDDFHVKIADFGVSCLETHRKSMKGFMGTYRWMAPEMIKQKTCSRKVDVYSFGIVLWELCTGLIPFGEMTPVQAAFAICQEKARPPIPGHCPNELAKLMQLCWSCNPARRPEFSWIVRNLERFDQMQAE